MPQAALVDIEPRNWRTSRESFSNGACVQAASWRTSTASMSNGHCVQAAHGGGVIGVRDTQQADGAGRVIIEVHSDAWRRFIAAVKAGEL